MSTTASVTRVGNGAAVLLPKALRQQAGISVGDVVCVASPRQGVLVLSREADEVSERLERYEAARSRICERARRLPPWPAGKTAEDLLDAAKEDRAHGSVSY